MQTMRWALALTVAGVVTACGGKGPGDAGMGLGAAENKPPPSGNASAEQVAKESRGRVRCPAKPTMEARAAGAPVDDVLGVRPGMSFEDAANIVLCSNDLMVVRTDTSNRFNIQLHGQTIRQGFSAQFAEPRVEKTSKQIMQEMQDDMMARSGNAVRDSSKPGQSKWYVSTMGPAEQERVIGVARKEWFEAGKAPTVDSVHQALLQKYGKPTREQSAGINLILVWAYDTSGRLVTETSPLFHQCHGNSDPDGGSNYSPDCGLVVAAQVGSMRDNQDIAQYMQVGITDQANGYELITATEQGFQQAEAQRRAKEVQEAAKKSTAPQL